LSGILFNPIKRRFPPDHFDGRVHFIGVPAVHDYGSKFTHSFEPSLQKLTDNNLKQYGFKQRIRSSYKISGLKWLTRVYGIKDKNRQSGDFLI